MKRIALFIPVFFYLLLSSCEKELVATLPECQINLTGILKVANTTEEDYILYLDTQYSGALEPGDVRHLVYPRNSGVNASLLEAEFDSVQRVIKKYFFIKQCDTLLFTPE